MWKLYEIQISTPIKFCWNIDTLICLCSVYYHFPAKVAELSRNNKDHVACKAWNIYYLAIWPFTNQVGQPLI